VIAVVAYYLASDSWQPGLRGSRAHARELLSFSLFVAGSGAINFVSANVDYLVVGRALGPATLGVYTLAYQFITVPLTRISALFSQVMFPAFSTLHDDPRAMREGYVAITRSAALIAFPLLAWGFVTAPELVLVVCGHEWLDAVPLIRVLSVAGALKSVGTLVGVVFRAKGKGSVELYWNLVWAAALTLAVTAGASWGSAGVAAAVSVLSVPGVLYTEWLACKYLELPLRTLLGSLVLPSLGAAAALAAGMIARWCLPFSAPVSDSAALRLLLLSGVTFGSAGLLMCAVHPELPAEARAFLGYLRGRRQWRI
jgi:O-antigen/teichoic acid export membrane protein